VLNSYRSQSSIVVQLGQQRGVRFSAPAAADCDRSITLFGKPPDYESLYPAGSLLMNFVIVSRHELCMIVTLPSCLCLSILD
jgi:hypothetical protein